MKHILALIALVFVFASVTAQNTKPVVKKENLEVEVGEISGVGNREHGKKVGEWKYYREDGTLFRKGNYKLRVSKWALGTDYFSEQDGEWKWFYKDVTVSRIENYRKNRKAGIWKYYGKNGDIIKIIDYDLYTGDYLYQAAIHGVASEEDKKEGTYLKTRSENKNNTEARATAFYMLANDFFDIKGYESLSVEYFKKSANMGNAEAQWFLSKMYMFGTLVPEDNNKAVYWLQKSADNGNAEAQNYLALLYQIGDGVEKNQQKAVSLFKKSAEQGNADAQFRLGALYQAGNGVAQNMNTAFYWFLKSAKNWNSEAWYIVGNFYDLGTGVEQNKEKALFWYKNALEENPDLADANYNLGAIYVNKGAEIETEANALPLSDNSGYERLRAEANAEYSKAVPYLEKYLELKPGDEAIENNLKSLYAILKLEESVDNGERDYQMGKEYADGASDVYNYKKAFDYFKKSAKKGYPEGQYETGWFYAHGIWEVMDKDWDQGLFWTKKSAENGSANGMYLTGYLYYDGLDLDKNKDMDSAIYWLEKALEKDPTINNAIYFLARVYIDQGDELFKDAEALTKNSQGYKMLKEQALVAYKKSLPYLNKTIETKPNKHKQEMHERVTSRLN